MERMRGWTKNRVLNQDGKDARIDQDQGFEPGWKGCEDRPRLRPISQCKIPNTVGAYCIRPQTFEPGLKS